MNSFFQNETFAIQNKSHAVTSGVLLCAFLVSLWTKPMYQETVKLQMGQQTTKKMSIKFGIKPSAMTKTESVPVVKNVIKKEMTVKKPKVESVSVDKAQKSQLSELNAIFDKVNTVSNPADMVPHYDEIDYTKNAKELGFVMENSQVQLPKLQGEISPSETSPNDTTQKESPIVQEVQKSEVPLLSNKELEAIANMLYNSLKEAPNETLPDIPSDWVKKWEGVEGLITVVALLVDDKGNVIKSALIKSSGIPKADTIIQYGLIGEKYDMKTQLKAGQYKWLELAISFNEDTF